MSVTMKEALAKAGVAITKEEEQRENEVREQKHRGRTILERPHEKVDLKRISLEDFEPKKYQNDPTDDLIEVPAGTPTADFKQIIEGDFYAMVWCADTIQTWVAPTKLCLDQNFVYREDLDIFTDKDEAIEFYKENGAKANPGIATRKKCYILDSPADEHYEVYYDTNFPSLKYGKATPNGMFIHKCRNRFHRDMKIMELDKIYDEASESRAADMTKEPMKPIEAIIISDGCFMKNVCASAYYYLDNMTLIKMTQGIIPSEPDQAVLISEICGAKSALEMCRLKGKKKITYYYDNTSILNVLRNRKTEYITEVVEYKKLLEELDSEGFDVKFVELHPKTGEDRIDTNKALMYFHNFCDKECQDMTRVFSKDYRSIAQSNDPEGKTYKQAKKEFTPKGRPGQSSGNRGVKNNARTGNNKYGKVY